MRTGHLTALLLASLVLSATAQSETIDPNDPMFELGCSLCHLRVQGGDRVQLKFADLLTESQEFLCNFCHEDAIAGGHPSGIVPTRTVPPEYPLDWKAEVTCSTCHHIHANGHAANRPPPAGLDSCSGCHEI